MIQNDKGLVMASLSQQIPLPFTITEVEALAAQRAVEFAARLGMDRVIIEGDSQIIINTLNSDHQSLTPFRHIANDVQYIASQSFNDFRFSHVRRFCNAVTHTLAQRAISSPNMVVRMEDVPPDISFVLQADLNSLP